MKNENDLDAMWFSIEAQSNTEVHSRLLFIERAYTAADCLVQVKIILEPYDYKVLSIYPMPQHHTQNTKTYQLEKILKKQHD